MDTSHSIPVTSGIPQGSMLGPVLFTMFVNDIPSIVSSSVFMFTDTKIFHVIRNRDDYLALQNDLNSLYRWSLTWQLTFNIIIKMQTFTSWASLSFGFYYLKH